MRCAIDSTRWKSDSIRGSTGATGAAGNAAARPDVRRQEKDAMKNPQRVDVLVCGAGPTGLVLALRLARYDDRVRIRIIDAAAEPGTTSRALVVHARTLEFYRQMGLSDALLAEGLPFTAANMWVRGRRVARAVLGPQGVPVA